MKKIFMFILLPLIWSCKSKEQTPQTPATEKFSSSTDLQDYSMLKLNLLEIKKNFKNISSLQDKKKRDYIQSIDKIIDILNGLEIISNSNNVKLLGGPVKYSDVITGIEALNNDTGLSTLYKLGTLNGFEITQKDIKDLLPNGNNFYSIRAYPIVEAIDGIKTVSYVLASVYDLKEKGKDRIKIKIKGKDTEINLKEELTDMKLINTFDPWPPRYKTSSGIVMNTALKRKKDSLNNSNTKNILLQKYTD